MADRVEQIERSVIKVLQRGESSTTGGYLDFVLLVCLYILPC